MNITEIYLEAIAKLFFFSWFLFEKYMVTPRASMGQTGVFDWIKIADDASVKSITSGFL